MSELAIVAQQTRAAVLTSVRTPRTLVFSLLLPVFLLVLFNSIFSLNGAVILDGLHIKPEAYLTGGLTAYAIALSSFTGVLITVATQREAGELKRLRGTPMPPWTFIVAQLARAVLLSLVMAALLVAIGRIGYGVDFPAANLVSVVIYVVLGSATLSALGIALTALTTTVESASAVGPFGVVILSFFSGIWIPVDQLSSALRQLGHFFPLSHVAEGLQRALSTTAPNHGLDGGTLYSLAIWAVVATVIAARRFRWEPQGK